MGGGLQGENPTVSGKIVIHAAQAQAVPHHGLIAGNDRQAQVFFQRAHNIHVQDGTTQDAFVAMRQARDATLEMPTLIIPSIQVNVRAGRMPAPEDNGHTYLKIPLNVLG